MGKRIQPPTLDDLAPEGHDMAANPYPVYAALRDKGPVHRVLVPASGEAWLVVTRDAARAALTDPRLRNDIRHSSSWHGDGGHAVGRNMLQTDPPQHTRLRRSAAGHFTPDASPPCARGSRPSPPTCSPNSRTTGPSTWSAPTHCPCPSP